MATVSTSMFIACRAFWITLKLAKAEIKECIEPEERAIAAFAISVAQKHLVGVTFSMAVALPVAICGLAVAGSPIGRMDRGLETHASVMANIFCNIVTVALLHGLLDSTEVLAQRDRVPKPPRDVRCLDVWSTEDPKWDAEVKMLAKRGFTLESLLRFYSSLGTPNGPMPQFVPTVHTTHDVTRQAIIPMSAGTKFGDCAMATVLMNGKETLPQKLVTHTWGNLFANLVAAIVADALRVPMYEHILSRLAPHELPTLVSELYWKGKLGSTYWVCSFSVNQHKHICHLPAGLDPATGVAHPVCSCSAPKHVKEGPVRGTDGRLILSEINKFDDMMDCLAAAMPNGFGQVIAVDASFELFQRAWCIAEIHRANVKGLQQTMVLWSECCWERHRQDFERKGLRVEDMQATVSADKVAILAKIPDKKAFNVELNRMVFDEKGLLHAWQDGLDIVCMLGKVFKMSADSQQMGDRVTRNMPTMACYR